MASFQFNFIQFFIFMLLGTNLSHGVPMPALRGHKFPTRTIANVTVIDTPIVRAAEEFARAHSTDFVYKHVMRSWLFGSLIVAANETLSREVDLEVHAVTALLHDLAWDQTPNSPFVSVDKRFEVDGAISSRNFIRSHPDGKHWEERRVQLVWDGIALHTEPEIANYKEPVVAVTSQGIFMDFRVPTLGVTEAQFNAILAKFPRDDFKQGVNETLIWLCQTKPTSTYNIWQQQWGDKYVANYSSQGNMYVDTIFEYL